MDRNKAVLQYLKLFKLRVKLHCLLQRLSFFSLSVKKPCLSLSQLLLQTANLQHGKTHSQTTLKGSTYGAFTAAASPLPRSRVQGSQITDDNIDVHLSLRLEKVDSNSLT